MDNELASLEASALEVDQGLSTPEPEPTQQPNQGDQPEPAPQEKEGAEQDKESTKEESEPPEPKTEADKKEASKLSQYKLKQLEKEQKAKLDAEWKKIRLEKETLQKKLKEAEDKVKAVEPTAEDFERLAQELQYSDPQKAQFAAQKAQEMRTAQEKHQLETQRASEFLQFPRQLLAPEIEVWTKNEQDIAANDPEFANPDSPTGRAVMNILNDPELGPQYKSSPYGIYAAYDRAKLHMTVDYLNLALKKITDLEGENTKLKGSLGSVSSSPQSAATKPSSDKDTLDSLYAAAARQDGA